METTESIEADDARYIAIYRAEESLKNSKQIPTQFYGENAIERL